LQLSPRTLQTFLARLCRIFRCSCKAMSELLLLGDFLDVRRFCCKALSEQRTSQHHPGFWLQGNVRVADCGLFPMPESLAARPIRAATVEGVSWLPFSSQFSSRLTTLERRSRYERGLAQGLSQLLHLKKTSDCRFGREYCPSCCI
jgi:hypothetical protein